MFQQTTIKEIFAGEGGSIKNNLTPSTPIPFEFQFRFKLKLEQIKFATQNNNSQTLGFCSNCCLYGLTFWMKRGKTFSLLHFYKPIYSSARRNHEVRRFLLLNEETKCFIIVPIKSNNGKLKSVLLMVHGMVKYGEHFY